jgi:prefoldin subunit 5
MAYFGGGAQPTIDWEARDQIYILRRAVEHLQAQVAELEAALKARDEADELVRA